MDQKKIFIRKKALSLRASITKSNRERWNKAISERFLSLDSVAKHSSFSCYVSIGTEVATMAIIVASMATMVATMEMMGAKKKWDSPYHLRLESLLFGNVESCTVCGSQIHCLVHVDNV